MPPGSERRFAAEFAPGAYRLRTLEIGGAGDIEYAGGGFPEIIAANGGVGPGAVAAAGTLVFRNAEDRRRTLIVEGRDWVGEALTAHRVTTCMDLSPTARVFGLVPVAVMYTSFAGPWRFAACPGS